MKAFKDAPLFAPEKGGLNTRQEKEGYALTAIDRFKYRTRYCSDSGIIRIKDFVVRAYQEFKGYFHSREKQPRAIRGLEEVYSLKRLAEQKVGT